MIELKIQVEIERRMIERMRDFVDSEIKKIVMLHIPQLEEEDIEIAWTPLEEL